MITNSFDFDCAEQFWLSGTDRHAAEVMYEVASRFLHSPRKRRLFGVASYFFAWPHPPAVCRAVVDIAERLADGEATEVEYHSACTRASESYEPVVSEARWYPAELRLGCSTGRPYEALFVPFGQAEIPETNRVRTGDVMQPTERVAHAVPLLDWRAVTDLFREVFGNPFRTVAFDSAWRSPLAVELASAMYELRAFGRMPELAAALELAGCGVPEVLAHCCASGSHVRGCWVIDLVLGRE